MIFSDCPVIFGILSSKLHKVWFNSLRHLHAGERPTYHKKIFETFPFPEYFKPNYSNNQKSKSSLYIDLKNAAINFIRTREELKYPSDLYSFKPNIADIYPEIPLLKSKKRMSMNLTEIYNSDLLNALQNVTCQKLENITVQQK